MKRILLPLLSLGLLSSGLRISAEESLPDPFHGGMEFQRDSLAVNAVEEALQSIRILALAGSTDGERRALVRIGERTHLLRPGDSLRLDTALGPRRVHLESVEASGLRIRFGDHPETFQVN